MSRTRVLSALIVGAFLAAGCREKAPSAPVAPPRVATVTPPPAALLASAAYRKLAEKRMSVDLRDAPLLPAMFQGFSEVSGVAFALTEDLTQEPPVLKRLLVDTAMPLPEILDRITAATGTRWEIRNECVVVSTQTEKVGASTVLVPVRPPATPPTGPGPADPAPTAPAGKALLEKLDRKAPLDLQQKSLVDALGMLSAASGVDFVVTPAIAKDAGDGALSLTLDGPTRVGDILTLLGNLTQTTHEVRGDQVVFRRKSETVDATTQLVPVPRGK